MGTQELLIILNSVIFPRRRFVRVLPEMGFQSYRVSFTHPKVSLSIFQYSRVAPMRVPRLTLRHISTALSQHSATAAPPVTAVLAVGRFDIFNAPSQLGGLPGFSLFIPSRCRPIKTADNDILATTDSCRTESRLICTVQVFPSSLSPGTFDGQARIRLCIRGTTSARHGTF